MTTAWLPADFVHPGVVQVTPAHHLRPIRADDLDLDFPAVMSSRERLWAMFGAGWGWPPADMTPEQDRADLARHEAEIAAHLSFNYALFDTEETALLGCVYIDPPARTGADADVCWWVIDALHNSPVEHRLDQFVPDWIATAWPFGQPRYNGRDIN